MSGSKGPVARRDVLWLVLGAALGLLAGLLVPRAVLEQTVWHDLDRYAEQMTVAGQRLQTEITDTMRAVENDGLPFCSDAELAFMRQWVYNSYDVRDVGRLQNGHLMCASGVGRLPQPVATGKPDAEIDGFRYFVSRPLRISPDSRGFVVTDDDVGVVLNPKDYLRLDQYPMTFGVWLHVPQQGVLTYSIGHEFPLSREQVLSGGHFRSGEMMYRSICPTETPACYVVGESVANVQPAQGMLVASGISGALLGAGGALLLVLYLQTQRSLERQLRRALREDELTLQYQPVIELSTGRVMAAEALVRWTRPSGEVMPPSLFIGVAEERGFISELTRTVLRMAIRDLGDVLAKGDLYVTINISAQDLGDPAFLPHLEESLREAGIPASSLGLELTERSTANHEMAMRAIAQLRAKGHPVWIDDFGTGFSSLSYLHALHVEGIKIDRTFTETVGTEAVTSSVVPQILDMASRLSLRVVVEGIETQQQFQYFAQAVPDALGQGYYFARPMPPILLRERLRYRY